MEAAAPHTSQLLDDTTDDSLLSIYTLLKCLLDKTFLTVNGAT